MKKLPPTLYIATGNAGKAREIGACFAALGLNLSVEARAPEHAEETAKDYQGNAFIKAQALQEELGNLDAWVLSDDSGLEVDVLGGEPGVLTARYGGMERLLKELSGVPEKERTARFVAVLVLLAGREEYVFKGTCHGHIAMECSGQEGFGYDPVFIPQGYEAPFAVLGPQVKNKVSHRAQALDALTGWLREQFGVSYS